MTVRSVLVLRNRATWPFAGNSSADYQQCFYGSTRFHLVRNRPVNVNQNMISNGFPFKFPHQETYGLMILYVQGSIEHGAKSLKPGRRVV